MNEFLADYGLALLLLVVLASGLAFYLLRGEGTRQVGAATLIIGGATILVVVLIVGKVLYPLLPRALHF